ncbi:restriction endonuclease [Nocardiopsis gilva]|uniref:restriction endonuclease n=1 Tax=Nocardiopsis gilva TaxID=280236 RepID=UPI000349AFF0|nr:hypothetical protein [Nocardiopsis gilva]
MARKDLERTYLGHSHQEQFERNIAYAQALIVGGRALDGLRSAGANFGDLSAPHPEDLYRAAWTQAVSALDHWLHLEVVEHAVAIVADHTRRRPPKLNKIQVPFDVAERLHSDPADSSGDVFRDFITKHIQRDTYQRSVGIGEAIRLVTTLEGNDIWRRVGATLGMRADEVRKRQDDIVDRRNRIAHHADLGPDGRRSPISADEADAAVEWINTLATALAQRFFPLAGMPVRASTEPAGTAEASAGASAVASRPVGRHEVKAWLVRAGRGGIDADWALKNGVAVVGFHEIDDLTAADTRDKVERHVRSSLPSDAKDGRIENFSRQLWAFRGRIEVGDLVVLPVVKRQQIAIGEVTSDYFFREDNNLRHRHLRQVNWIREDISRSAIRQDLLNTLGAFMTVCKIHQNDGAWRIARLAENGEDPGPRSETIRAPEDAEEETDPGKVAPEEE